MPTKREQATKTKNTSKPTKTKPNGHSDGKASGTSVATALAPAPRTFTSFHEIANFIWSVADLLRGDYKQADYGKVILPLTVLRRCNNVIAASRLGERRGVVAALPVRLLSPPARMR